eukprot:521709_1
MEVTHSFTTCDEKEQKRQEFSNTAIICVGTTGTGKSSLINLFCGNAAVICHGVNSGTKDSHLFTEKENRFWLDSQGSNDSEGVDDKKVMCDILKRLYAQKISSVKIIWCIEGGVFDRAKYEFKVQAKFIKSLGGSAWKSTIIIQKGGRPNPKRINGLLAAAREEGCDINYQDNRLFGFTGIEYGNGKHLQDDELYQDWLEDFGDNPSKLQQKFAKYGYYTNQQIKDHVNQRLSKLAQLTITFTMSKCQNCGVIGDTRFVFAPCHVGQEKYHPEKIENYHPDDYKSRMIHTGSHNKNTLHPGVQKQRKVTKYDSPNYRFHSGSWTNEYYHPGSWTSKNYHSSSGYTYKYFGNAEWGHKYKCCGGEYPSSSGCCSKSYYTCCNWTSGDYSSYSGCSLRYYWSCCSSSSQNSDGCSMNYYTCCNRDGDACTTEYKWTCCNRDGEGCIKQNYYECCDKDEDGCKTRYKCCKKSPNEEGCKDRCSNADCHNEWGSGPGCTNTCEKKK